MKITILFVFVCILYRTGAFRAYDCFNQHSNFTTISLTSVDMCTTRENDKILVTTKQVQIVQEKLWRILHIYHCNIVITKIISHCGMHSHVSMTSQGLQNYIMDTTKTSCMSLHKTGEIIIDGHRVTSVQPNTTSNMFVTLAGKLGPDGTCSGESFSVPDRDYESVVVQGSITMMIKDYDAMFEIQSDSIVFNDGTTCKLTQQDCEHPTFGSTYWESSTYDDCSTTSRDVIYEGIAEIAHDTHGIKKGDIITVNQGTSLFSLTITSQSHVCHQRAFSTDHARIYMIEKEEFGFYFTKGKIIGQNMDLTMYMNSKISFTTKYTEALIKQVYKELTKKDCEIERMALINRLAIIRQHPLSFGHLLTGEPGYYSVVNGEVAHMMKCQPVDVIVRKSNICTSNLPVLHGNISLFMEPVARILTNVSMEVPCSVLTPSTYEIQGSWYHFSPNAIKIAPPITLSPSTSSYVIDYQNMAKLVSSGLYDHDAIEDFKKFMSFPLTRMETNSYVSAKISGSNIYKSSSFSPDLLISEGYIVDKIKSQMLGLFGWMSAFGTYAAAVWGMFMIYKLLAKVISVMINAFSLHRTFGCGLHMMGSCLDAMTHLIFMTKTQEGDTQDQEPKGIELQPISKRRWMEIAKQEGWDVEDAPNAPSARSGFSP